MINALLEFFGRLHPIFVHFPIAMVIAAALAELLALRGHRNTRTAPSSPSGPHAVAFFCLSFGAIAVLVAGTSGWLLASFEEFNGDAAETLFVHRWGAVSLSSLVLLCWLSAYLAQRGNARPWLYQGSLVICVLLTGLVGHTGGTLVHGDDLFSFAAFRTADSERAASRSSSGDDPRAALSLGPNAPAQPEGLIPAALNQQVDFDSDIHPIFQNSCAKCHAGGKAKGGFRIDTRDELLRGGETGAAIVPGNGAKSYLVELAAGLDPDKVMPKKGRRLTANEVALLRTWIDQGARWGKTSADAYQRAEKPTLALKMSRTTTESVRSSSNPIDVILDQYFRQKNLEMTPPIDDRTFMRRVSLDLIGRYPTFDQVQSFATSQDPHKRAQLVESLLSQNVDYALHWISFWNDLLRNDYTGAGYVDRGRKDITAWLFTALVQNYSYTRMVSELVHPNEASSGFVRGIVWRGVVNPNERPEMQAAQNIAQAFMGVNLKCSSCHDSFVDHWTLEDAYGLANVYAKEPLESHRCDVPTGKTASPRFFYPELGEIRADLPREKRTERLAHILTSPENGLLAKTIVNRVWAQLMGAGIVNPLDDMSHAPWSEELLESLATELQRSNFDLKQLLTTIVTSSVYQRQFSSEAPPAPDAKAPMQFAAGLERRMKSEQFEDTLRNAFSVPESGTKKEWLRFLSLLSDTKYPAPFIPRAKSSPISSASPSTMIDADISGAKTLWLVAVPEGIPLSSRRIPKTPLVWSSPILTTHGAGSKKQVPLLATSALSIGDGAELREKLSQPKTTTPKTTTPKTTASKSAVSFLGKPIRSGIPTRAPSILAFDVSKMHAVRFHAEVGFQAVGDTIKGARSFRFLVFTDLSLPASLQDRSDFATALGRLARDTIVSQRPDTLTTLDALELTNGEELHALLRQAAQNISRSGATTQQVVQDLWRALLLRDPSEQEAQDAAAFLGADAGHKTPSETKVQDLLWSLALLPEFQLIR